MPRGKGGPERGISLAARSLPIPGKTDEAKRKHLSRSNAISTKTTDEAKQAIRMAGLADSTRALVEVARTAPEQQVAKVQEISDRRATPKPPRPIAADKALDIMAADIIAGQKPTTISSPIVEIAKAAADDAVTRARAALDEFLGRFACLTEDQQVECLKGRDLSKIFDIATKA
jgi:hypothetical protein